MEQLRKAKGFICDMDGVIYHGNKILPGVKEFVEWLYRENKQFLFLTNNSGKTPKELQEKLARMGLEVDEHHFYTSALATAEFISRQSPGAHVFVIGEPGLYNALYEKGITLDDTSPDYVVIGESSSYNYDNICKAVHHVQNGARLIGTNYDLTGPTEQGIMPACRAFVKPIELVTGKEAYYIGKPNPLMMRTGLRLQISVLLGHFVGSMVITSLALRIFYGYPWATLAVRIPNALILSAVNVVLLRILLENRTLMKMVKK